MAQLITVENVSVDVKLMSVVVYNLVLRHASFVSNKCLSLVFIHVCRCRDSHIETLWEAIAGVIADPYFSIPTEETKSCAHAYGVQGL